MKWSRKQYMDHDCTHDEYYEQFVTDGVKQRVLIRIGKEALEASTDPDDLNDIPLKKWDAIGIPLNVNMMLREARDYYTLAGAVCINKRASQMIIGD